MPWRYFDDELLRLLVYYLLYITFLGLLYNNFFFNGNFSIFRQLKKLVNGAKYLKSVHVYCLLSVSVVANTSGFINKGSFNVFVFLVCLYVFVTKYNNFLFFIFTMIFCPSSCFYEYFFIA